MRSPPLGAELIKTHARSYTMKATRAAESYKSIKFHYTRLSAD